MHRRICFLLVIVALLIFSRPGVHAGTPHTAYGKVQYSNGTHSASISFSAYVTTRSLEILTQSSAGCQYAPATGDWVVQCGSFTTSWAIGDVLHIDFNDGAGGSGSDDVILTSNPYDDAGTTVLFVPPVNYQITITTGTASLKFVTDGTEYTGSHTFTWPQGSSHPISVNSPQSGAAGTRYIFQSWSDGGVQSHSYTVPGTNETLTAYFKIQHELVVMSGHGNPQGAGWYDAGSIANFGISSPEAGSTGTRYVFTGWTGSGSGSYTGADAAKSVTLNNPVTETAGWKTQYRLTTAENPDAGGNMTPVPPGGYYDAGTVVTVDASVAAGYAWAGWSGDLSGTVKPGNVTVSLPRSVTANFTALPVNVQITVQTDPGGKQFTVDGVVYTGSSVFGWVPGSLHSVSVNSSQSGAAGMRYVFVGWSDGGVQNHSYTVPGTNETLTVHFRTQYELVVVSGHGNPEGAGWYDAGTTAAFSLRGTEENGNTRWLFSGWSGDYTGMNTAGSILMNQAKTLYAGWKTQYKLNVVSPYGNPQGGGWYDSGTKATFSIGSVAETGGTRHVFNCWTGSYYGIEFAGTLTVNEPKSVQAIWYTQHFLSISVYPASCGTISPDPPGIWIDDGNVVTLRASAGSGCRWYEWTGDLSGDANPAFITMNGPKSVTGNFSTTSIYRVTTDPPGQVIYVDGSDYISPCDFPWAYETTHSVGVDSLVSRESGIRHVFQSWSDGGARTHQVIADAILIFTATIPAQCYLTISTSPDSGGTVLPPPPGVWMNRGMVATLFAVPKTSKGYGFTGWSGDRTGISNPDTLVMNGPRRVSATFTVQSYAITLQTDPVDGGSIVKIPAKGIYRSGETLLLQAVPKTGYVFEFWSGDAAGSANPTYATMNGNKTVVAHFKQAGTVVTPETKNIPDPSEFALEQNYPNPFNPKTLIRFRIPEAERVSIQVFNSMGEKVRTLINETKNPGGYQVLWDGMSDSGQQLSAGTYLIVLQAGDQILRKKSVFIK